MGQSGLQEERRVFESHWSDHGRLALSARKLEAARQFLQPVRQRCQDGRVKRLLDAGCGDGVHAAVLQTWGLPSGVKCYGVDLSLSALQGAQQRVGAEWCFMQADVGRLPLAEGSMDTVYAFGVLEYTPAPKAAFGELARVLAPGGLLGVWVLSAQKGAVGWGLGLLRRWCALWGPGGCRWLANMLVPLLYFIPSRTGLNLSNADWGQCREALLVNLTPPRLHALTESQVRSWFAEHGLQVMETKSDHVHPITLWGLKTPPGVKG